MCKRASMSKRERWEGRGGARRERVIGLALPGKGLARLDGRVGPGNDGAKALLGGRAGQDMGSEAASQARDPIIAGS